MRPIGGVGNVIELDEMKMGRRKYNRGRTVDSSWILGFVDNETNEVRLEICSDNKRDRDTLFALIERRYSGFFHIHRLLEGLHRIRRTWLSRLDC